MKGWIWRMIEARVNALVTERIIAFHDATLRRGQIPAVPESAPVVTDRSAAS